MNPNQQQILDYGNCGIARFRGKEAYIKDMSPRTETGYKADGMDKLAPHSEALDSVPEVNLGVVYRNSALLPGEASYAGRPGFNLPERVGGGSSNAAIEIRGVSRDHSSPDQRAGSSPRGEESGGLSQDEGSNLRGSQHPNVSLATSDTFHGRKVTASFERTVRNRRATDPYGRWCGSWGQ